MSVHSSLRSGNIGERHRNVLKRYERIQRLQDKELWPAGRSPLGLPKVKSIKFKVKKAAKEAASAEAGTAAPGVAATATPAAAAAKSGAKPAAKGTDKGAEKGAKK